MTELRVTTVRRFAREQLGLREDPGTALPIPTDSTAWDIMMGHHDVSDPDTTVLLSNYVRAGGGPAGTEAFARAWLDVLEAATGDRPQPLRDRPSPTTPTE